MTDELTIEHIEQEVLPIVDKSKEVARVVDAASEARAAEFCKQIALRLKEIKEKRTEMLKPIKDHVKRLEAQFNSVSGPLEDADALVRQGMTAYRNSQAFKAAEAERKAIEERTKEAAARGDVQTVMGLQQAHEEAAAAAPKKVETQSGEARFRKVWKYEIVDLEQLPAGYWVPDEKKISAAIKAGIAVPGVKAWQEDTPVIV